MNLPAKRLLVFCILGAGAALWYVRHQVPNAVAPAVSSQHDKGSSATGRRVPQAVGTTAESYPTLVPSQDDFAFVANSAKKALEGDGKAAREIAGVLEKCIPVKYQYRDKQDPEATFENELVGKNLPQWAIDRMRAGFLECRDFIHGGNAFAGLPDRPGGYESMRFWNDLAYRENDPTALAQHAAGQPGIVTGSADSSKIRAAQIDINKGAATGDPEALFRIGFLLADGRVGQDPLNGFAVMIAACNLGYDCTTNNEFAFGACAAANACQQGEIYTDKIRDTIGDADYARAYSRALQLQDALARADANAVLQFVQLKGVPSTASK
jgi:hypothetical protein